MENFFFSKNFYREMSPLLLLLAKPSLAFEIKPDISPIRFGFSSCGLIGILLSFCVKSLTVWSRFSCNSSFLSSFSDSMWKWKCEFRDRTVKM